MKPDRRSALSRRALIRRAALGAVAAPVLWQIACGGGESKESASGAGTTSGVAPSANAAPGATTIKVRMWDNPQGFDPATLFRIETENVAFNIYNALTSWKADTAEIVPDLAEKWETADALTYTFTLNKGVKFHKNFGELTSRDVKWSYERVLDPATGSAYATDLANLDSIQTPDPTTVVIKLKQPDVHFLHQVGSYHQGQVLKEEAVKQAGEQFQRNPIGTGPFIFDSWMPNSEIVMVRNPEYFRGPAKLEKVIYRIIKDASAAEVALKNGEVDIAGSLTTQEILDRLKTDSKFTLHKAEGYAVNLMMLGAAFEPFQKLQVRQAIAHAIDFPAVFRATAPDTSSEAASLVPKFMSVYSKDVPAYKYDATKAKALLKEAGYGDGFSVKWLQTSTTGVTEAYQLYQSYLDKVGIKLQFDLVETTVFNQRRARGDYEISGRLLPAINPDTILFGYLHPSSFPPKGLSSAKHSNPRVTEALEAGRRERDEKKRLALYADAQRQALTDLWYIPMQESTAVWPAYKSVQNVAINKLGNVDFYPVSLTAR